MSEQFKIPKEVSMGASVMHITGQYELYVENYKNIIAYTNEQIKLQAKTCKIYISGKNLEIEYFNESGMKIHGRLKEIEFV